MASSQAKQTAAAPHHRERRRPPKLHKHPRSGWYYAVFYDPLRTPKRKWSALGTNLESVATSRCATLAEQYADGSFSPWLDSVVSGEAVLATHLSAGVLYAIEAVGTPYFKVGLTRRDVHGRIKTLQTGSPHRLSLFFSLRVDDCSEAERILHSSLAETAVRGEWFELTHDEMRHVLSRYLTDSARVSAP